MLRQLIGWLKESGERLHLQRGIVKFFATLVEAQQQAVAYKEAGSFRNAPDPTELALCVSRITFTSRAVVSRRGADIADDGDIILIPSPSQPNVIKDAIRTSGREIKAVIRQAVASDGAPQVSESFLGGAIYASSLGGERIEFGMSGVLCDLMPWWAPGADAVETPALGVWTIRAENGAELMLSEDAITIRQGNVSVSLPTKGLKGDAVTAAHDAMRRLWHDHARQAHGLMPQECDIAAIGRPAIEGGELQIANPAFRLPQGTPVAVPKGAALSDDVRRVAAAAVVLAADTGGIVAVHHANNRCALAFPGEGGVELSECDASRLLYVPRPLSCDMERVNASRAFNAAPNCARCGDSEAIAH